ncbi:MAG TPA: transporter (formate/nitrite transporter family protein) [Maritimibacter sp.]|nr:transporter (formate/nitrite transporter family protein) [Maritimibacter sp.]
MTEEEQIEAEEEIREAASLSAYTIYEVIRRDGEEELARDVRSLIWSGISAGIVISLSVLAETILRTYLPDASWSYLVENLGYSLGFLVVIVGRMQLFTENTISSVLPVFETPTWASLGRTGRLWVVVLLANVVGAFAIALFYAYSGAISGEIMEAFHDLSEHATGMTAWQGFVRGIPAGILVAAIVWMLPEARHSQVAIIVIFTWLIAAGDFTHIVAGSVEMAYLMVLGDLAIVDGVTRFFLPVLAGNVMGGTAIFSMLVYGQTKREREAARTRPPAPRRALRRDRVSNRPVRNVDTKKRKSKK